MYLHSQGMSRNQLFEIVKAEFHKLDRAKCERVWVSLTDIYWQILLVVRQVRLSKNWRQITNPPRSPFAG